MNVTDLTLQEVLAINPTFHFNVESLYVESNLPDVFMTGGGRWSSDVGRHFVLNIGTRKIGFGEADDVSRVKGVEILEDGTNLWWFDALFCKVWKQDKEKGRLIEATNTYILDSLQERDAALELFVRAMKAYDLRVAVNPRAEPKVDVKFTDRAIQALKSGEFVA